MVNLDTAEKTARAIVRYRKDFRSFAQEQLRLFGSPMKFWPCQIPVIESIENQFVQKGYARSVILKSRQVGMSTLAQAFVAWRTMLWPHTNAIVIADQAERAKSLFDICRSFYEQLDESIKPMGRYATKSQLVLANPSQVGRGADPGLQSRILVDSAHKKSIAIGASWTIAHLSESARYPDPEYVLDGIIPAVHLVSGTMIIIESSAEKAGTWFRDFFEDAQKGRNAFEAVFVPWFLQPEYFICPVCGLNVCVDKDHLKKAMKILDLTGDERHIMAEHALYPGHINWMRLKLAEFAGDWDLFRQSFPLCVSGDTRVGSSLGLIRIEEASELKELTGNRKVIEWHDQGEHETLLVETYNGYSLRCTPNHPFVLTDGTLVRADSLGQGQEIQLISPRTSDNTYVETWYSSPGIVSSVALNESLAALLGYYLGDGSFDGHVMEVGCDARDLDVVEDVERLVAENGGEASERRHVKNITRRHHLQGAIGVRSFRVGWKVLLDRLGVATSYLSDGRWHRHVRVPEAVFKSPLKVISAFLQTLFESDGYAGNNHTKITFCNHGLQFVRDVQLLLLCFGIKSRVRLEKASKPYKDGTFGCKTMLYLQAAEATLFHKMIGFVSSRKRAGRRSKPEGAAVRNYKLTDVIHSVSPAGKTKVYDFSVRPDSLHETNGILTHNTPEDAWVTPGVQVFPAKYLKEQKQNIRPPKRICEVYPGPRILDAPQGKLYIWKEPEAGKAYDIGVDIALGIGKDESDVSADELKMRDASVACIVERGSCEQVAQWYSKALDPFELATTLYWLGMYYNTAQIAVETNAIGSGTNSQLAKMSYANQYIWRYRDEVTPRYSKKTGWETSRKSKAWLVGFAVHELVNSRVIIRSELLLREMENYVRKDVDEWGAVAGKHDDLTMSWMIAVLISDDESFEKYYGLQKKVKSEIIGSSNIKPEPWEADLTFRQPQRNSRVEPWD